MWQTTLWHPNLFANFSCTDLVATANPGTSDAGSLVEQLRRGDMTQLMPLIEKYLVPAIGAILVLIVAYFVARILSRIASVPVRKKVDETLGRFVAKLVFYAVMLFSALGILGMFGISVASFAAVLASAGFAIGLAFQGSLGNLSAGILLLVFRPFKVGDFIVAGGVSAKVYEIDLFSTTFDTTDNRRIIVPNGSILSGTIENHSHHDERRVEVLVGVDYSASLDQTREVLSKAALALSDVTIEGENRGFSIVLGQLADSSVIWKVRVWAATAEYWNVQERLTNSVKTHLDQHGIGIPFPQMDVHLSGNAADPIAT